MEVEGSVEAPLSSGCLRERVRSIGVSLIKDLQEFILRLHRTIFSVDEALF